MTNNDSPNSTNSDNRESGRKSWRLTVTVPWAIYRSLEELSSSQGRSISNLACYLLERQICIEDQKNNS
jgi:hypothetical protein